MIIPSSSNTLLIPQEPYFRLSLLLFFNCNSYWFSKIKNRYQYYNQKLQESIKKGNCILLGFFSHVDLILIESSYLTCGFFWIKPYTIILYFLFFHWQKWNSVSMYINFPHGSNSHLVQSERRSNFNSVLQLLRSWYMFTRLEVCKNKRKQTKSTIVSFVVKMTV